jgi:hypothetical protein
LNSPALAGVFNLKGIASIVHKAAIGVAFESKKGISLVNYPDIVGSIKSPVS